jgi:two-component system, NtrC family, sensor kinase
MIQKMKYYCIGFFSIMLTLSVYYKVGAQNVVTPISEDDFKGSYLRFGSLKGWSYLKEDGPVPGEIPGPNASWISIDSSMVYSDIRGSKPYLGTWFRLKFSADPMVAGKLNFMAFAPQQIVYVYLNDSLIYKNGIVDKNSTSRHRAVNLRNYFIQVNVKEAAIYDLKIFAVNHLNQPLVKVKRKWPLLDNLGVFVTSDEVKNQFLNLEVGNVLSGAILVLSLLFWMIFFLNKHEKATALIATCVSLLFVGQAVNNGSIFSYWINHPHLEGVISQMCIAGWIAFIPLLLNFLFNNRIHWLSIVFLVYAVMMGCLVVLLSIDFPLLYITPIVSFLASICITAISWKKISGAQWIVVTGLLVTVLLVALYVVAEYFNLIPYHSLFLLLISSMLLSFPLSLLVYTAVRQRNLLEETRLKAKENVDLAQGKLKMEEENRRILAEQNIKLEGEVDKRTAELKESLENLKTTQAQLIQKEKMASLGELTAGIAHEIQNPLNFVNNFSEVSKELLSELSEEIERGNYDEVKAIAGDVVQNLDKIQHHGKRADGIVKGMLQHSRISAGQREPTDINALCDEYLRLAYHGLKAKEQSFEASLRFEPDNNLPEIYVVPQDMGRVLLNLINNAIQAVNGYAKQPLVTVSTRNLENAVEIMVADNGPGIPGAIRDKIFQPFFTTKPTGQGTGLGLSLSYDIVKAHGGELKVETKEGEGSQFIIQLPI